MVFPVPRATPLPKSWWHGAMVRGWGWVGSLKAPRLLGTGLSGSELSALLRRGLGRGTEEGEGEEGEGAREGGLPSNHYAATTEEGFLKS